MQSETPTRPPTFRPDPIAKNCSVFLAGAGATGCAVAEVTAAVGHPVVQRDNAPAAGQRRLQAIRENLERHAPRGRISAEDAVASLACISVAVGDASYSIGPLAGGRSIGVPFLLPAIRNLSRTYGEHRDQVPPWLMQAVWELELPVANGGTA